MSMTREEIVERLEDAHMNDNMGAVVAVIQQLNADIAERALPVTREWLEQVADRVVSDYYFAAYFENIEVCLGPSGDCRVYPGRSFFNVTTRGQLLDLLSGLGVTK